MKHIGDISVINGFELEPVDVVTGGSPCQDLSVAGKRLGIKQFCNQCDMYFNAINTLNICPNCNVKITKTRSGLFIEQIRIIKEMRKADEARGRTVNAIRPRYMVWENVPGAFSSNRGEDFRIVLEETIKIIEPDAPDIQVPNKGRWPKCGCFQDVDGRWSIAYSFGEFPSAAVESHLSQILEDQPHQKYYLSAKACLGIIRRAERRGKELPEPLLKALILQSTIR